MPTVRPIEARSTIRRTNEGVAVALHRRRLWWVLIFAPVWLCGWAVGEVAVGGELVRGAAPAVALLWLLLWTAGGLLVALLWLWNAFGRETLLVDASTLTIRRAIGRYGRNWHFDRAHVRDLRVSPAPVDPFSLSGSLQWWGVGGGVIAFDYGARTYRFGAGLHEAEAKLILAELQRALEGMPDA